jgi:tetratricopeptide (TPR) repeat protein
MKTTILIGIGLIFSISTSALTVQEKGKIVEDIYKKIYAAGNDKGLPPTFKFDVYKARQIAYMMLDSDGKPMIGFESKAFDVCEKFGERRDDAIAFILGHEISHHTMKHNWGNEFRSAYSISALEQEIKELDKGNALKFETQADENGGILCYMAGYNTTGLAEQLLTELYKAYELKESPKYPSLEERIKIAQTQDSLVLTYIKIFETGNYAMMIKDYDLAIECYTYVENKFKSREIYNNYGVALFLSGVAAADEDEIKYIYPVEIDLESKINPKGSKGMGDDVKALFEKAILMFEKAVEYDKNYFTAKLNIACSYSVLKNYRKARNFAEDVIYDADKVKDKFTILNAKMVLAIVSDLDENTPKNSQLFDDLIAQGHLLSEVNKQIMDGEDISNINFANLPLSWMDGSVKPSEVSKFPKKEMITGLSSYTISALQNEIPNGAEEVLKFGRYGQIVVGNLSDSRIYFIPSDNYYLFHATKENYEGETALGIKLGSSKEEVLSKYGAPSAVNTSKQGLIMAYEKNQMLFVLDYNNKVSKWILWKLNL